MAGQRPLSERRRSQRVRLATPVEVVWKTDAGDDVNEHAETEEVNAHGAVLRMKTAPPMAAQIELAHGRTGQMTLARVVAVRNPSPEGLHRIAVELAEAIETFWGISLPPLPEHQE